MGSLLEALQAREQAARTRVEALRAEMDRLADCLEVVQALAAESGILWHAVEAARQDKHRERGGFTLGRLYEAPR